ncbi:MAG: tRNA (N(6)-L-threonylcarbamoyladenosine(37)-C(2))-methylthiotransferase MtaB [Bacteroidota bacterium]
MSPKKTVAFHTIGCKLNFSETSSIGRMFEENNFARTSFENNADVYVINTCSVTEDANRECRRIVRNALRNSPEAFIIVTGCYAQLNPKEIASIKGVDIVLGTNEKFNMLKYLNGGHKKENAEIYSREIDEVNSFVGAFSTSDRTRAFLKVQDGCDYTCAYCTVPLARGKSRSDTIKNVVFNVNKIVATGVKEIVLTGVNVGDLKKKSSSSFLSDKKKREETFLDLIQTLDSLSFEENKSGVGIFRFRISSIEPNLLTDEIIEFVASSKKFVPHFHIALQSGSDKILRLMHRKYQRKLFADIVQKIKLLIPHCCIGADVIVGFPGETEKDFLETHDFISGLNISYLHVFTYSERKNTEALKIKEVVPMEERKRRNKILRTLSEKKQNIFYQQNIGTERTILFESKNKNDFMFGFTENYIKVKTKYNSDIENELVKVKLENIDMNDLRFIVNLKT